MQWLSIEFSGKLQVRGKESWSAAAVAVTVFFCLLHFKLLPVYGDGSICRVYGGSTATTTTAMMGTDATTTQSLGTHWRATAVLLLLKCELTESVLIEKAAAAAAAAVASIEGAVPSFFLLTDYHDAVAITITIFSERLLAE